MNKIKVCLSALWFPLTMAGYFWRAFERREDVELFVVGPFSDDYIPWNYGMKLPRQYVRHPHYPLPMSVMNMNPSLPAEFVQPNLPWVPDLWLQIDAGWHLSTKPKAGIVGHIQTDPHVLKSHYQHPKTYSDVVWCMQTPYLETGEVYLPYGYDPTIHFPVDTPKIYDACLVGLHYEQRNEWVSKLRQKGVNVYYSLGEVYDQYRDLYNQSRVALSWSSLQDLPARVWEGMAMGLPVVTNRVPDLTVNNLQEGVHFRGFSDVNEAVDQVIRLLVDPSYAEKMGHCAREQVQGHTWDARVEQILGDCGLL